MLSAVIKMARVKMAVEEFQFKLATAKDLPVFWFELVLCPDKFRSHLNTLLTNPNGGGNEWSGVSRT